jgi:hypothetical protein
MLKLLNAYVATRSLKAAQKVRAYDRSHPMGRCMLDVAYQDLLADAIHHANAGIDPRTIRPEELASII